ncbi:MAG: alpha/beta hydrolase [Myxococcales bacterium]|nr:alpha/beta hydrolase [Myxococcales bacterium]
MKAAVLALLLPALAQAALAEEGVFRKRVVAADGTALALYRYVPSGGGRGKPAVLLVPELGFGREAYDLSGSGLARFLQANGREVYLAELRGQGKSGAPTGWRLSQLVSLDLPAVAAAIRAERPGPLDLLAHGYSGTLALAASEVELRGAVRRVVALSTPVFPEVPSSHAESLFASGGKLSGLGAGPPAARTFELLFALGGNFPRGRLAELRGTGLSDLGKAASSDLLGWMREGDLELGGGSSVRRRIGRYGRPTLLFLPLGDNFAHPEFASPLREVSAAKVTVRVLSRVELLDEDYSHLSLLHGEDAEDDVFEPALEFLDAPEPASAPSSPAAADGGADAR